MHTNLAGKGFVVICDTSDTVVQIIQNEYEFAAPFLEGGRIADLFDDECLEKVQLFLSEARLQGSVFDWELVVKLKSEPATLHCAAAEYDNKLLIVGASSRDTAIEVIEGMLRINNEQTNQLRTAMKELQNASSLLKSRDNSIYEEMTLLNNQLSSVQRELMKKNHELEKLNVQKNYFLGMASHDLRSPLQTIVSYCELMQEEGEEHSRVDDLELIAVIRKSSEFMLGLINDLLDISKIESGNLNLKIQSLNLLAFITDNIDSNRVLADKKDITIEIKNSSNLPEKVYWDCSKIEQVLNNLLGNAIKFSHKNRIVTVALSTFDNSVTIEIMDSGDGLPDDVLQHLFIPFSKGSRIGTNGEKGTGLGLAICRRIVEGHGGKIIAENITEGGTRFITTLPIGATDDIA